MMGFINAVALSKKIPAIAVVINLFASMSTQPDRVGGK